MAATPASVAAAARSRRVRLVAGAPARCRPGTRRRCARAVATGQCLERPDHHRYAGHPVFDAVGARLHRGPARRRLRAASAGLARIGWTVAGHGLSRQVFRRLAWYRLPGARALHSPRSRALGRVCLPPARSASGADLQPVVEQRPLLGQRPFQLSESQYGFGFLRHESGALRTIDLLPCDAVGTVGVVQAAWRRASGAARLGGGRRGLLADGDSARPSGPDVAVALDRPALARFLHSADRRPGGDRRTARYLAAAAALVGGICRCARADRHSHQRAADAALAQQQALRRHRDDRARR